MAAGVGIPNHFQEEVSRDDHLRCSHRHSSFGPTMEFFKTFIFIYLKKLFNVNFERDRQNTSGGAAESDGDTESETGSRL